MNKIKNLHIRTESLPLRCEICHQTDCFNPDQNWCSRCKEITVRQDNSGKEIFVNVTRKTALEILLGLIKLGLTTGGFASLILVFFWAGASTDAILVLAVLSLLSGLLGGLIFGIVFILGILAFNGIEKLKWYFSGKRHPLEQF